MTMYTFAPSLVFVRPFARSFRPSRPSICPSLLPARLFVAKAHSCATSCASPSLLRAHDTSEVARFLQDGSSDSIPSHHCHDPIALNFSSPPAKCEFSLLSHSRVSHQDKMEFPGGTAILRSASNGIVLCASQAMASCSSFKVSRSRAPRRASLVAVSAKIKKGKMGPEEEYPWPEKFPPGEIKDGALKYLNRFKPLPNPQKPLTLPFERPIADLERKIDEVRELANETGLDFTDQIVELEERYDQVRRELYGALTPMQRLSVARHPSRPTFLDHVMNMTDSWIELHGDRGGFDDPALVCGIGSMDGMSFMFIGHQKGRNTKENIHRNFAMPMPNGYRKALRFMRHAEKFGFPILTFIDTPGAYAGVKAEELGQGEAIAVNLREMFGIRVPIIATVIGEGGSGGALAIGCGNKMIMLENAVYYVASPEACAAILWKTSDAAPKAADALRITAHELQKLDVVDDIIPEPVGGAHSDPVQTSLNIKATIMKHMKDLLKQDPEALLEGRYQKFRKIGAIDESGAVDPHIKRNMKKRDALHEDDELRMLPSGNGSAPKLLIATEEVSRG